MTGTTVYWKSFDVIDDYTIRVNFTTWQNRIMTGFGMPSSCMVSRAAFEKNGVDWMRWNMVGTGPFIQKEFQRDVTTRTVKNADYWDKGKPYLDAVQYLYVADEMTRLALFRSGGAEQLDLAGSGRIANDLKAAGYKIESQLGGTNVLIPDSLNADFPWSNVKVRQAAEYAIDKEAMNRTFGYGYSQAAYQLPSPSTNVYDPNFSARKYDTAKAKQLLAEAGFPNGFKTRLIALGSGSARDVMVTIQSYFEKVGIQAELEFPEPARMTQYTMGTWKNALIYQYIFEWPNYNYGLNLWFGVPTSWFQSLKKPDGWKEGMTASMATKEPDKAMMQKLVKSAYDDAMVITLNYPAQLSAVTANVRDTGIYSRIQNYFWNSQNAWLSK
jgi:peptide/nickel transport system substrate-binding protein